MNNKHLFLFTIGPVQSFIAQARKTQDLYAGSQILSELVNEGIKIFQKENGNVIFPNPQNKAKPNRFLGKVENCNDLLKLGQDVENVVRTKFTELAQEALTKAGVNRPTGFDTQINNHLEVFWVFEEIVNANYKTAYKNIEQNLGTIKNVRPFEQMPETGRKCSLDGERNALFYKKTESGKVPNFIDETATTEIEEKDQDDVKVAKGEGLSAVSLLKRFYDTSGFPSTAEIALMQDEKAIDKADIKECLASYKRIFSGQKEFLLECLKIKENIKFDNRKELIKQFDYQQLFEENINEKNIPNPEQLACAKRLFPTLKPYFKSKYYALLVFDGDKMGKILSGKLLQNQNIDLAKYQNDLSKLLGKFAKEATEYLDEKNHNGQTVYAGGDDFVGFVNLHCLFKVLKELRDKFDNDVNKELQKEYKLVPAEGFTFSAGIAIAHYKTPLDIVLKTAKAMEHKAKEEGNRNAFAISVLKHSGESHESVFKWEDKAENLTRVSEIVEALKNNFSDTWIINAQREFYVLQDENNRIEYCQDLYKTELKRLLKRSVKPEKKSEVANLQPNIELLLSSGKYNFQNFSEMLNICRFINKELKTK